MHPFFYNHKLGLVKEDSIESGSTEIGGDAWIGERAILTPKCRRIGIGAVVGAGAVVTKDVDDFSIVAGNPARHLRYRFDGGVRQRLLDSRWWERPIHELKPFIAEFLRPAADVPPTHPILSATLP